MARTFTCTIKPSLISRIKELAIEPEFVQFGTINFSKLEIIALRYGIKYIQGYRFRIGRIYCIDIQSMDSSIIKIRLSSLYRIRRIKLGEKYKAIAEALFENYFNDISRSFIENFTNKIDFDLLGNTFTQEGIILARSNKIIYWPDLGTKDYYTYYSLFSLSNPDRYRNFNYLTEWNTMVLHSVSRYILESKKLLP